MEEVLNVQIHYYTISVIFFLCFTIGTLHVFRLLRLNTKKAKILARMQVKISLKIPDYNKQFVL